MSLKFQVEDPMHLEKEKKRDSKHSVKVIVRKTKIATNKIKLRF
jgi:hypothetical protein